MIARFCKLHAGGKVSAGRLILLIFNRNVSHASEVVGASDIILFSVKDLIGALIPFRSFLRISHESQQFAHLPIVPGILIGGTCFKDNIQACMSDLQRFFDVPMTGFFVAFLGKSTHLLYPEAMLTVGLRY